MFSLSQSWHRISFDRQAFLSIWIPIQQHSLYNEICQTARESLPDLAEPEYWWPAWRPLPILPFERIDDLHAQLTVKRATSQAELIKELKRLVQVIENAESSVATVSKAEI